MPNDLPRSSALRLLLAALLALAVASCQSSPSASAVESYCRTQDGKLLFYRELGQGAETLVVPSGNVLGEDLTWLADGRRVVFYDLRGRGRSDAAQSQRLDQDLMDLEELRLWLGIERFSLLGFDYGAALATHYALRHPDRVQNLVLVSPIPLRKVPYWEIYERINQDRMDEKSLAELQNLNRQHAKRLDPEAWAATYRRAALSGWVVDLGALDRMESPILYEPNSDPERVHRQYMSLLRSLGEWDWRRMLSKVTAPTLVVRGAADPVPRESLLEWSATLPAAADAEIAGSGRLPWVEQRRDFQKAVADFLGAVGG